ncbi:hypothetical protein [Sphaerospermopsis torques-reginae]|uniref:Uncharacterized protein n=1 Tax=Sphaerospermopsis torques-reginae ITEP-024 TaxID=984208 RepID=A0ABX8WXJ3_9CYAN|nr:hypothetical protein [Sphaerospermopsis torques-reginae]QYX31087.1 hypothetical protein K2F26_19895 [Sphaerospermopsis torques-reginae ITEP-024]
MNNKLMRSLVAGVIFSVGMLPLAAQAEKSPVADTQVAAMVEALRLAAPQKKKPTPGYHTDWQIKPQTLKGWSRFCLKKELTTSQFENDPKLTRQVVSCIIKRELTNQFKARNNNENAAVTGAACWWMTGLYTGCDKGFTGDYVKKVVSLYQQEKAKLKAVNTPTSTTTGNTKR